MIPCEFCEVECVASEIEEHKIPCGSRTDKCDICGNHILVRMLKAHEELHERAKDNVAKPQVSSSININRSIHQGNQITAKMDTHEKSDYQEKEQIFPKFRNVICQNIFQASAAIPTDQHNENPSKCEEP